MESAGTWTSPSCCSGVTTWSASSAGALVTLEAVDGDAAPEEIVEPLRDALRAVSDLGVAGAFPRSVAGSGVAEAAELLTQRTAVAARVRSRLAQAGDDASVAAAVAAASEEEAEALAATRIRAVLGKGFPVLPFFTAPNAPALVASFAKSDGLQGGDLFAAAAWLERAAKVQPRAGTFLRAVQLAEALSDETSPGPPGGPAPWRDGDIWAALPQPAAEAPRDGRLSLVAQLFGPLEFDSPLHGLVLEEFAEVIPRERQTTGVSFHFDAPGSRAPQAMLLLTLFDTEPAWSDGSSGEDCSMPSRARAEDSPTPTRSRTAVTSSPPSSSRPIRSPARWRATWAAGS